MKYFILFILVSGQVYAADRLNDFNKKLMENFDKDMKAENDLSIRKVQRPSRGPASVAPEINSQKIQQEKKIDKNDRQFGPRDW